MEASLAARGERLARELKARVETAYPILTRNDFPISGLDSLTKTLTEFSTIPSPRREILIHSARTTADEELIFGLRWHEPFASASEIKAAFATADRQRRIQPERFL